MTDTSSKESISILGCGWLGLPLAQRLLSQGHGIKGSTTTPARLELLKSEGIVPYLINLNENAHPSALAKFLQSDTLIINYPPGVRKGGGEQFISSFTQLLKAIEASPVKTIIYVSSTSVYPNTNGVVAEDQQLEPTSEAGRVLLEAENELRNLADRNVAVLRMAGLVGYDRQPARFFAGKKGLKNGNEVVNLIHRDDCLGIIEEVLRQGTSGAVLNCCSDTHPLKSVFYPEAAKKLGLDPPEFEAPDSPSFKIVSNEKLKAMLPYQFKYGDLGKFDWP